MARYRTSITYLAVYFFAIGTALRFLTSMRGHPSFGIIVGLLAAFLLLLAIEPWLTRRSHGFTHVYLAVQTGLIIALSLILISSDVADYISNLQALFGIWLPGMYGLQGVWGLRWDPSYRLPVMAAFT